MYLRSRSRSPGESRSSRGHVAQLPEEVLRHVEFGIVDPSGEDDVRLRGEIPFTNVETTKNIVPHRPAMSAAAATTRSINRLHTKTRSNYRPPPPPPTTSSNPYNQQGTLEYPMNIRNSETRSEVSGVISRQNNAGYPSSASHNNMSSSPNVYSQNTTPVTQSDMRPQENFHKPQFYAPQKPTTPQHFYNNHRLSQNYDERSNQQNSSQPQIMNRQLNQVQYARPNSSVSSSPNMMKGMPGMNAPSPMNSSSTGQYNSSNAIDYNHSVPTSYQNTTVQQNNSYAHQHHQNRLTSVQNSPYHPQSSTQNSRVYTVNQPRPSPRHINNQYPISNPPINSSTPIRHQSPQHFSQQISGNVYNGGQNKIPSSHHQSDLQGPSNGLPGNTHPKPGIPGQLPRAPPSYQSPYSASVSNMVHQQPYSTNRGSNEQLNAKMNQFPPQKIPSSNSNMSNGGSQFTMDGKMNYNQNPNNMFYHDNSTINRATNGYDHGQSMSKGNYALPVNIK